jgi:phosphatidylethanolamine/phosphatidyl-N-methylethanolamine N-methyltransferase
MKPVSEQAVIRTYRRYAPVYDRLYGAVLEPGRRALTDAVASLAPRSLLEVGVGTGLTLARYPAKARVVGIDISAEMLQVARERISHLGAGNVRLECMNAEAMTFEDATFDCVVLPYVLSVTPNPARLVREVRRVCRPGGTILLLNHFSGSRTWWLLESAVRPIAAKIGFRSDFDFDEQVRRHDWGVQAVRSVNLLGLSKLVTIRNVARSSAGAWRMEKAAAD